MLRRGEKTKLPGRPKAPCFAFITSAGSIEQDLMGLSVSIDSHQRIHLVSSSRGLGFFSTLRD